MARAKTCHTHSPLTAALPGPSNTSPTSTGTHLREYELAEPADTVHVVPVYIACGELGEVHLGRVAGPARLVRVGRLDRPHHLRLGEVPQLQRVVHAARDHLVTRPG